MRFQHMANLKKEKIIFIGNQDNIGFLFCREAISRGYRCILAMRSRNIPRSDPDMLGANEFEKHKEWITLKYKETLQLAEKYKNITLISSGIEIQDLLKVENKNAIKILIPTGSDLGMWPFVDEKTALAPNYPYYASIFYKHRFDIDRIFAAQSDNLNAATVLGISDRIDSSYIYGIQADFINQDLKDAKIGNKNYKRIFFAPGRKNGDPNYTHYKGSEKLPIAYDIVLSKMSKKEKQQTLFLNSLHGNTNIKNDFYNFRDECESVFGKHEANYKYAKNLTAKELWSVLKDERVIAIDQFGKDHGILGGCAREAMYFGSPVITGSLGKSDLSVKRLYGSEPYVFEAHTSEEIAEQILKFVRMPQAQFEQCRNMSKAWATIFTSKSNYDGIFDFITSKRLNA